MLPVLIMHLLLTWVSGVTVRGLVCLYLYVSFPAFVFLVHLSTFSLFSITETYYYFVLIDLSIIYCTYGRVLPSLNFIYLFFWRHPAAGGILVPQPGIAPAYPAVEAGSLNH